MISMEFGIIDQFDPARDYGVYDPAPYHCIALDDDLYMNDWYVRALDMPTCFQQANRPAFSFDRWGVTLIPPASLPRLAEIVRTDSRFGTRPELNALLAMIQRARREEKWMIHFGI